MSLDTSDRVFTEVLSQIHRACWREGPVGARRLGARFRERGDRDAAALADAIAAAVGRQVPALTALATAAAAEPDAYRPETRHVIDWSGFWTLGPDWRSPLADRFPAAALPAHWRADREWLAVRRRIGAGRAAADGVAETSLDLAHGPARVEARLNGTTARAILDTGAPTTLVSARFAARAGLVAEPDAGRSASDGSGAQTVIHTARADSLAIGDYERLSPAVDVLETDLSLDIDAIVSPLDLAAGAAVLLDGEAGVICIGPEPAVRTLAGALGPRHRLIWSEGAPYLRATLGRETRAWLLLDTGAGATVIVDDLAQRLGFDAQFSGARSATAFGDVAFAPGPSLLLRIAGLGEESEASYVKPRPVRRLRPLPSLADGYLGRTWFLGRRVMIAADRRTARVSACGTGSGAIVGNERRSP